MFATSNHDLPYPSGTDLVIEGDDAIEALAERLDTIMNASPTAAGVVIERANSLASAGSGGIVFDFPGMRSKMTAFTYSAGSLVHTGPPRTFIVEVEVELSSGGGVDKVESSVSLRVNGSSVAGSHDVVQHSTATISRRDVTHRVTTPVRLETGTGLDVFIAATPTASIDICGLKIYPIGPAE